ncbi:DUF2089 family protein [Rhodohalobacter barkolensis]|nr:DUF2089 family protein [Rhodohalobacter barkolensis]
MEKRDSVLPVKCPSCNSGLVIKSLFCKNCETTVTGLYELPKILLLEKDELDFIHSFVKNSGSLKEMAKEMKLSYPTVRNYLNDLIEKLNQMENEHK